MDRPFEDRSTRSQVARLRGIAERALGDYPFDASRLRLVLHGYNTTFRVDTADGRTFALRLNVNSRRSVEHLAAEAAWLAALGADPSVTARISVPVPVPTRSGSLRTTAWSDDLDRDLPVLVTSWLPGRDLDEPDVDGAFALGAAMAVLHDHVARWSLPDGAALPDVDDPIDEMTGVLLADRTITTPDQRSIFAATLDRVASLIAELRADPSVPVMPIHADLHGSNVKWFRRRIAVFDFDDACVGTPVHDLAISLFYLRDDDPVERALLDGYASVRPLPAFATEQLEAIVAARNLVLAGDVLTMTTADVRAIAPDYLARSATRLDAYLATGRFRHHPPESQTGRVSYGTATESPFREITRPVGQNRCMTTVDDDTRRDLTAADVAWDIDTILPPGRTADDLFDEADAIADRIAELRGTVATLDAMSLAGAMRSIEQVADLLARAGHHALLSFSTDTADPARGAAYGAVQQRSTAINTKLIFFDLEWAAADDEHAAAVLADPALDFCRHHLRKLRLERPYQLSESAETIVAEKAQTGSAAWSRLFDELTSAIEVDLPEDLGGTVSLMQSLALLQSNDPSARRTTAEAVTQALTPTLRTRAYVFNTLLLDKAVDDRLRGFPSWVSSQNLANEASDESVQALVDAVVRHYSIPQRWYALKAQILGVERLADYDRMASVASADREIGWSEATDIVLDAYASFSPELADVVRRFFDESWIDAPQRPGKRGGAFAAPVSPGHHPYVFLNWSSRQRDVATLAHELGHGVHFYLAREQGIFHQGTPLTLAETASVFGETVTSNRLLSMLDDPNDRFALLASTLEDSIATVFRQVAMNRFEDAVHTARRDEGELSVDRFGDLWAETQTAMLGDAVEVTEGYRSWWSYVPHFIARPGYVYAYAYGQLLALSVYARYLEEGDAFVPAYLELLRAGGSRTPEELGRIVGCDLTDPSFWDDGLRIVQGQLDAAEQAARDAGRIPDPAD